MTLEFIREKGGSGGTVFGSNTDIPHPSESFEGFRGEFLAHLKKHGEVLLQDKGEIREPFVHEWGQVDSIYRDDADTDIFLIASNHYRLPHKAWKDARVLEEMVLNRVADKMKRVKGYEYDGRLWLAIRNINDVINGLSDDAHERIDELNQGAFSRITVFHDPWDILDARPIGPRYVDVRITRAGER